MFVRLHIHVATFHYHGLLRYIHHHATLEHSVFRSYISMIDTFAGVYIQQEETTLYILIYCIFSIFFLTLRILIRIGRDHYHQVHGLVAVLEHIGSFQLIGQLLGFTTLCADFGQVRHAGFLTADTFCNEVKCVSDLLFVDKRTVVIAGHDGTIFLEPTFVRLCPVYFLVSEFLLNLGNGLRVHGQLTIKRSFFADMLQSHLVHFEVAIIPVIQVGLEFEVQHGSRTLQDHRNLDGFPVRDGYVHDGRNEEVLPAVLARTNLNQTGFLARIDLLDTVDFGNQLTSLRILAIITVIEHVSTLLHGRRRGEVGSGHRGRDVGGKRIVGNHVIIINGRNLVGPFSTFIIHENSTNLVVLIFPQPAIRKAVFTRVSHNFCICSILTHTRFRCGQNELSFGSSTQHRISYRLILRFKVIIGTCRKQSGKYHRR